MEEVIQFPGRVPLDDEPEQDDRVIAEALHNLVRAILAEPDRKKRREIKREAAKLIHAL